VFHVSIWRAWSFVWGAKITKDPGDDGTEECLFSKLRRQNNGQKTILPFFFALDGKINTALE